MWNQDEQRIWTLGGIIIDSHHENEKAQNAIRSSREFDSEEMNESDLQFEKHDEQGISMPRAIIIDWNDEMRRQMIPFNSIQSWIWVKQKWSK
jgi:hypothetical protein